MQDYPVVQIDCQALRHNLAYVKKLASDSQIMAVIKADAYGHGAKQVAHILSESDAFAVARIDEAIELRAAGVKQTLVVLEGANSLEELRTAEKYALSLVFHHAHQIQLLEQSRLAKPLSSCWLMLETGMYRLGFPENEAKQALLSLRQSANISGHVGVMSHFANADEIRNHKNEQQWMLTRQFAEKFQCLVSMANSAAILSLPQCHAQWVRPGLILYGISPFADKTATELGLKVVMKLVSQIIAFQNLKPGEKVGYGGNWTAQRNSRIAIIDIGYGDGYSRQLSNNGKVLIKEQLVPVVGRVSMDMIAIDVTEINSIDVGDEVILWGDNSLPVEQVAQWANTIAYELVCQVNSRVRREYING